MQRDKTENSNRAKLSLRNLLNLDLQSSQFKSVNLNSRPNTMYTQRQLKVFTEDRAKLMSEDRIRRGSSQQLQRAHHFHNSQAQDRAEKQKLKHTLGKINLLADGAIEVTQQEKITSIYLFLESLSKTENFYKKSFKYIHSSFDKIVYIKNINWDRDQLQYMVTKTKCPILIKIYNGVKDTTYKEVSDQLYDELAKQLQQQEQYQLQISSQFAELQAKLEDKTMIIKKQAAQIHFYQNHPSKEQFGYITQLQHKVASLEKDLKQSQLHVKELQNSEDYLNQYTNMLSQKLEQMRFKLHQFEMEQFNNMKDVQKNSQLKLFQQNVELLKDLLHKGTLRMSSMREQYNKMEIYNQELLGQRSVLAKRAAVGFAELTPRPNYKQIFMKNDIDMDKLIPDHHKPTTEELFTSLLKCFKKIYSQYVQKQEATKLQLEKTHQKMPTSKDPGKLILAEIDKARHQIKKVEHLSNQVHRGYHSSKEAKEAKQKNKKR